MTGDVPENISVLLASPIEGFLNTNIVLVEGDKTIDHALILMKDKGVRSVLVSHFGEVIGIVSKTDILFKVMARGKALKRSSCEKSRSAPLWQ